MAASASAAAAAPKVLMVMTSQSQLGSSGQPTGVWLSELTHPLALFKQAGVEVEFASIRGGAIPLDPGSVAEKDAVNAAFLADAQSKRKLENTPSVAALTGRKYDAVVLVGGHGTMWDFAGQPALTKLVRDQWERGGVLAAVCHGVAGLADVRLANGKWLLDGRSVTGFSNAEEAAIKLDKVVPYALETRLREQGARYAAGQDFASHVVVDGRLVTGQNPASAEAMAQAVLKQLGR
ncbi:type 1 glutamine amidotransferase domain-containing protein [Rhodobacteraceae bacterium CH30]|nr:type 1 glutamine amidotransferase domain-containing protein [Rhodobacteraceae bacterium CH30]